MTCVARRRWLAVGLWAAAQLTLTSLPARNLPAGIGHPWDWLAHAAMYAVLGVLVARAAALDGGSGRRLVLVFVLVALAGALDELHQILIPGRDPSFADWACDVVGAGAGLTTGRRMMASAVARWLR